ncbi:MAG TPA: OmpA family protein [Verrucomicrobiae bacterium]|nr:OmpA family protein [Verrucomicrobiae bacterium]
MQQQANLNDSLYNQSIRTLQACQQQNKDLTTQKNNLQLETNAMKLTLETTQENNNALKKQIQAMSAISAAQAESIKKSIDNMGAQDTYMMALHYAIARRDSVNMALVLELKAAIGGYSDQGLQIKLDQGTVHVDLTDSLLFGGDTTSYTVTDAAKQVLSRMSRVINDQPSVDFTIEGHTDSLTDAQDSLMDSWDLSTKRATAIARLMQTQYRVSPGRITAAGRGEFAASTIMDSAQAATANRITRFVFAPQMEEVLRLLEHRQSQPAPTPAPAPAPAPPPTAPAVAPPPAQTTQTPQP